MVNSVRIFLITFLCVGFWSPLDAMDEERGRSKESRSSSPQSLSAFNNGGVRSFQPQRSLSSEPRSLSSVSSHSSLCEELTEEEQLRLETPFREKNHISRQLSFFRPPEELSASEDDSPLMSSPFRSDKKEKSTYMSQLIACVTACTNLVTFMTKMGCCGLCTLLKIRPEALSFEWTRLTDKHVQQVDNHQLVQGHGGVVTWDCRNSSYWCKEYGFKKFAVFMQQLGTHLFGPIGEKYHMTLVGMNGDGPLFVRQKQKDETDAQVAQDTILASLELIARYPKVKKEFKLNGPAYCGVGCSMGTYYQSFVPIQNNSFVTVPSFVSENINTSCFCEQANKQFSSALVIDDCMHQYVSNQDINKLLSLEKTETKLGSLNVWIATHKRVCNFYDRALKIDTTLKTGKSFELAKKQQHNTVVPTTIIQKPTTNEGDLELISYD